jgi:hypothetical protein
MGRIVPTFAERYPDCLPAAAAVSSVATADFIAMAGSLDAGFENLVFDEAQRLDATKALYSEAYVGEKGGLATGADWGTGSGATAANPNTWLYREGPKIGVAVDAAGNLCANLQGKLVIASNSTSGTAAMDLPKPTAAARAFIGSITDAWFQKVTTVTDANDATKRAALTATAGTNPGLINAVAVLPEATFTKLTAGVTGTAARTHLKYWEFLAALHAAPALCDTAGSGKLSGVDKRAICARDLAGLWAAMIAYTNSYDAVKAKPATSSGTAAKPYHLQGFEATGLNACKRPHATTGAMTAPSSTFYPDLHLQCTAAKVRATPAWSPYSSAAGKWCNTSGNCAATTVVYVPAGPLGLAGVLDTYHFATHAQGLALGAAGSALKAPATVLGLASAGSHAYWLSGVYKWMVPMGGRPAPHNIMTGLWEPSAKDAAAGVPEGFGAVTKLLAPDVCGTASKGVRAQVWRDSWKAMVTEFKLAAVPLLAAGKTGNATVVGEKPDCAGASTGAFPSGVWAQVPVYFTPVYKQALAGNLVRGAQSQRCWGTQTVSVHLAYKKGAYAACAFANAKTDLSAGTSAENKITRKIFDTKEVTALTAATTTLWGTRGTAAHVELRCRAAALLVTPTSST